MSKKCCGKKHVDLLFIGEKSKKYYVLIKGLIHLYDQILHRGRKHFFHYCLQTFSTEDILKHHIQNCFKINVKKND